MQLLRFCVRVGRKIYLDYVHVVPMGKHCVHISSHLLPQPRDGEGVETIAVSVKAHVDGSCGGQRRAVNETSKCNGNNDWHLMQLLTPYYLQRHTFSLYCQL